MKIRKQGGGMKRFLPFIIAQVLIFGILGYYWGNELVQTAKTSLAVKFYNRILHIYVPQMAMGEMEKAPACYEDILALFLPVFSYSEQIISYESQTENHLAYETLAEEENENMRYLLEENSKATVPEQSSEQMAANTESSEATQNSEEKNTEVFAAVDKKVNYAIEQMRDFDYLRQTFYQVDSSTTIGSDQLNVDKLLAGDVTVDKNSPGPQILIYHTHASETYADSVPGDAAQTVVGVGEHLTQILTEKYGWSVLHHTGIYDTKRDYAYSCAAPAVSQLLADNPSIQVVLDLHRDGIAETTHLLTEQNGVPMAKVMFFNGLCYSTSVGPLTSYPNPYLEQNLALSFQMQLAANEYYPDYTRRIYLKAYRYNQHFCPKSMLVEVGAQTNTLQEAMNAMDPLADILDKVLTNTAR